MPGFNVTTTAGSTIKDALDFAMAQDPKDEDPGELYPVVASVAAVYGDPDGKYAAFLAKATPSYPADPYFLWSQPLSDSGWVPPTTPTTGTDTSSETSSGTATPSNSASTRSVGWLLVCALLGVTFFSRV